MATTYYFLSAPTEQNVLSWFREQPETAEEHPNDDRVLLFYRQYGPLAQTSDGSPDATMSPLVSIFFPKVRRSTLWTVGEVHFLYKSKAGFSDLERLRRKFQKWLQSHPIAWERQQDGRDGYGYYLEGGIQNIAEKVFALPTGGAALEAGRYFVAEGAGDYELDRICKALRLRGVNCS